jgi:predicted house-cleaning noncanonical NTP pyrophosphatase (MazG superfamily)
MTDEVLFSNSSRIVDWSECQSFGEKYGRKAAGLLTLPRLWTPPFALIPVNLSVQFQKSANVEKLLGKKNLLAIQNIGKATGNLIVRSSIVGESIWDRGKYKSVIIESSKAKFAERLRDASDVVLNSAPGKRVGLIVQSHVSPIARGEFGNLLRISKTRDHWELSNERDGTVSRVRINSQRDPAANVLSGLLHKRGLSQERLFGSVAAWINNALMRGRSSRVTGEWIADNKSTYFVQIDEEDEDFLGVNPFQLRVEQAHQAKAEAGTFLRLAQGNALREWDKLVAFDELAEPQQSNRPKLFYLPLVDLKDKKTRPSEAQLAADFGNQIGPDSIVVRTSIKAGKPKITNLRRSEGMNPSQAAKWVLATYRELTKSDYAAEELAFVAHRFVAARASAWVRADPANPNVEIHCLWGLPDALQYCPYDIWEVHVPTSTATENPDYKSNMLIAKEDGNWEYVRIKNELGRSTCVTRSEANEIALRTFSIAKKLGKPIHVMWFVGCVDAAGSQFSIPWYWLEAHDTQKNLDRSSFAIFEVKTKSDLAALKAYSGSMQRLAVELMPTEQKLMRDEQFIAEVGKCANAMGVPVILSGSTLAHAYYVLRRELCTVVTKGEKEHSRVRKSAIFGKLVRDKIPQKIAGRGESEITQMVPESLKRGFLFAKLIEEALEVRNASREEKKTELADLFEVVRTLAKSEGYTLGEVEIAANAKLEKSGGFDDGLVLLQTGILGRDRLSLQQSGKQPTQVLSRRISGGAFELPFTVFGFLELDQPRTLFFDDLNTYLTVTLKSDRIVLELSSEAQQLELELNVSDETASLGTG